MEMQSQYGQNGSETTLEYFNPESPTYFDKSETEKEEKSIDEFLEKINNYVMTKHLLRLFSYGLYGEFKKMKENLERKTTSEPTYVTRFEREGKIVTWNNIILKSAFLGLCGTFLIDGFTDSQYIMGFGSLTFSLPAIYAFYNEAKKKVKEKEYVSSSIFG